MKRIAIIVLGIMMSLTFSVAQNVGSDNNTEKEDSISFSPEEEAMLKALTDSLNAQLHKIWDEFNAEARAIQTKSICGVDFGCTKEEARRILSNKYGTPMYNPTNENVLSFERQIYAGINFNNIHFIFQSDGRRSYLNTVIFVLSAKSLANAKERQSWLAEKLEGKYKIRWIDEDTDQPEFYGGISPLWNESYNIEETLTRFFAFRSDIIKYEPDVAKTAGFSHSVRLIYGPYDYVVEEF